MNEKINKIRIDIISLILIIFSVSFFGVIGVFISFFLLLIYIKKAKEHYLIQKILLFLCFSAIVFSLIGLVSLYSMEGTGIDSLGTALASLIIIRISYFSLILCSIILLIIDNRKQVINNEKILFKKNVIIPIILVVIIVLSYFPIHYLFTTEKVSENIPTVYDFEKQLTERGLKTSETDYRLYGINNKSDKAIKLFFEENSLDKYPLYVYSIIDYPWIIYYANGEIYAIKGKYWDYYTAWKQTMGFNEEKIICDDFLDVKSETKEISVYNRKYNRYEKGNAIKIDYFNYYSKNKNTEDSIFIDIPRIDEDGYIIEQVNRVDINTLHY